MRKVIISLAPVKAGTPIDRVALAEDVKSCVEAGAAMCHLHCRRPDGSLTPDTTEFIAEFEEILKRTDVVVQASTGGVSDLTIEERCNPLDYWRVESSSLMVEQPILVMLFISIHLIRLIIVQRLPMTEESFRRLKYLISE